MPGFVPSTNKQTKPAPAAPVQQPAQPVANPYAASSAQLGQSLQGRLNGLFPITAPSYPVINPFISRGPVYSPEQTQSTVNGMAPNAAAQFGGMSQLGMPSHYNPAEQSAMAQAGQDSTAGIVGPMQMAMQRQMRLANAQQAAQTQGAYQNAQHGWGQTYLSDYDRNRQMAATQNNVLMSLLTPFVKPIKYDYNQDATQYFTPDW